MELNAPYLSLQGGLFNLQMVVLIFLLDQLHLQLLSLTMKNRNMPLWPTEMLLLHADVGIGWFGEPVINLLNGSLVFGGPSLLAVVQLLQITLHVDHLLLGDKKQKKGPFVQTHFTRHHDDVLSCQWGMYR